MLEATGDLWETPASWRLVTTNGILNSGDELVMGAGVALQAKQRFPGLPQKLGRWVLEYGNRPFFCKTEGIISFPTKYHWKDHSNIVLIWESAKRIVEIADKFQLRSIVSPRPGCGRGGLTWDFVKPHIEDVLDDRFTILSKG